MKNLTANEIRQLVPVFNNLESDLRHIYGKISGGFVKSEIVNYDDNTIDIHIKSGCQSDCANEVNDEDFRVDRKTMKVLN